MSEKHIRNAVMQNKRLIFPPYDTMIDMDGYDAICAFSQAFSGGTVYVPSLRTIFKECIEQEINNRYNGKNIRELAKDYGLSVRHVRNLIQDM